ncbi:MAG: hypothetical protein ACK56F_04640, partial [bacterium]
PHAGRHGGRHPALLLGRLGRRPEAPVGQAHPRRHGRLRRHPRRGGWLVSPPRRPGSRAGGRRGRRHHPAPGRRPVAHAHRGRAERDGRVASRDALRPRGPLREGPAPPRRRDGPRLPVRGPQQGRPRR